MTPPLDCFLTQFYAHNPVSATFIGVHDHDAALPNWSNAQLDAMHAGMRSLHAELGADVQAHAACEWEAIDADLARGYLEIREAEDNGSHGIRANPALWTGEAIFGVVSLMLRPSFPMRRRAMAVAARLESVAPFLANAKAVLGARPIPAPWTERALRECDGAALLLTGGIDRWLQWLPRSTGKVVDGLPTVDEVSSHVATAAAAARAAFTDFAAWLTSQPAADERALGCGDDFFDLLLTRGHQCRRSRADLLADVKVRFADAVAKLDADACATVGSWSFAQERMALAHPLASEYLAAFERTWALCHQRAERQDLVTWPEGNNWPLRYVLQPEWAREAAPYLYFLPYRSPAPEDAVRAHDYLVPPVPAEHPERHLSAWNHSVIKLNHVVHHGAIGHHLQNWHAYHRSRSRIGRVAAVDCSSRIALFCGGTMAEGWACYATELMEEAGFLTPLEKLSEQHSRVRFLARAIVDISLHQGTMTFTEAVRFYADEVGMSDAAARSETTKNSMFPGTGLMYWLGTQGILDLREELKVRQGAAFSLKQFHDDLLEHGSIPVPLVARRMLRGEA